MWPGPHGEHRRAQRWVDEVSPQKGFVAELGSLDCILVTSLSSHCSEAAGHKLLQGTLLSLTCKVE